MIFFLNAFISVLQIEIRRHVNMLILSSDFPITGNQEVDVTSINVTQ